MANVTSKSGSNCARITEDSITNDPSIDLSWTAPYEVGKGLDDHSSSSLYQKLGVATNVDKLNSKKRKHANGFPFQNPEAVSDPLV